MIAEFRGHSRIDQGHPDSAGAIGSRAARSGGRRHARTNRPDRTLIEPIETASRDEIAALQTQRLKCDAAARLRNVPAYRKKFDDAGVHPDDFRRLADLAKFPFTTKADLRDNYPFGMFAVPREQARAHPRLVRHDRQADRRRLHAERHRHLGGPDGALDRRLRRPPGHDGAHRLRLRPVHRRARRALRRRAARLHRRPGLRRHDRAAGAADRRFRARDHHGDAVLHAGDPRRVPAHKASTREKSLAQGRHLRRRALDQRHARRDRGGLRHARGRHLRPLRGDGAGRRQRMRRDQGRPAHLGGSFLSRDHRSRDRRGAAGRREGRAGLHHAHQGGACRSSATARAT